MNPVLYRTDAWFDGLYERGRSGYIAVIAAFLSSSVVLTGISAFLGMPGSLLEAFLGGSAGLLAFIGARGFMMHYYRSTPDTTRPVLRERMGPQRGKTLAALAGAWLLGLIVLGAQGTQHPAIGALTIVAGLTLITLATKTPEEKTAEVNDETYWSSDPAFYDDEYEEYEEYGGEYDEDDYWDDDNTASRR